MASRFARIALALSLMVTPALFAQNANTAPVADTQIGATMPNDPSALLSTAAKVNGLNGPNLQPWHIKASYQIFDSKGKQQESGTYEEFWISDKKYRRSYTSRRFTQTDIATGSSLFRSGNQNWPDLMEAAIRWDLTQPIPELNFRTFSLEEKKRAFGKAELLCIAPTSEQRYADIAVYCLAQGQPVLRFDSSWGGAYQTVYNEHVLFQGHFVAKDIRTEFGRKPYVALHVDTIEALSEVKDSDFVPPSDAVKIPRDKVTLPQATTEAFRVLSVAPIYPDIAKMNHVQGTVVVETTIGKDGTVVAARAISGPPVLRPMSVDSVRQWKFRPFLILGEPVEVQTRLQIIFTLG